MKNIIILLLLISIGLIGYSILQRGVDFSLQQDRNNEQMAEAQQEVDNIIAQYDSEQAVEVSEAVTNRSPQSELSGTVLLSGLDVTENETLRVYSFDLVTQGAFETFFPGLTLFNAHAHSFGNTQFFLVTLPDDYSRTDAHPPTIYQYDRVSGEKSVLLSTQGASERHLNWSQENNLLIYNKLNTDPVYSNMLNLASWDAEVVDVENDEVILASRGMWQPKFMPDGETVIYLGADGLNAYNVNTFEETLLATVSEGGVTATSMLDLSEDGTTAIWTTAKKGTITIFEIEMTEGSISATPVQQIVNPETEYYWPVLSPDGEYYAIQAISSYNEAIGDRENPRLEIRATYTDEVVVSKSLDQFDFNALFLDDWIE